MNRCSRKHRVPLRSREPRKEGAVPGLNTPAGVVDGSVTSCTGKAWGAGGGAGGTWSGRSLSQGGRGGGRQKGDLSGGPRASMGAAHLTNKNTPILILVLIFLKQGLRSASLSMVNTETSRLRTTSICSYSPNNSPQPHADGITALIFLGGGGRKSRLGMVK